MSLSRNLPNILSFLRIVFVYPYVVYFNNGQYKSALLLFFCLGLTDALDGILARNFNWRSEIGAILDPLADKVLLVMSCYLMWRDAHMPLYLFAAIVLRDFLILFFGLCSKLITGKFMVSDNNQPSLSGKVNTALLLLVVVFVLLNLSYLSIPQYILEFLFYVAFISCFVSGLSYLQLFIIKVVK